MTNLSGGLLRGIQEAQRSPPTAAAATLVLLSDGHANEGVTDHGELERFAAGAQRGRHHDLDDRHRPRLRRGPAGRDRARRRRQRQLRRAWRRRRRGARLEVDGLLAQASRPRASRCARATRSSAVRLFNDLPATAIEGGFMAELGDLYAGETRRILLEIDVPALAELGLAKVCELELRWVDIESMKSELATIPVSRQRRPGRRGRRPRRQPDGDHRARLPARPARQARGDRRAARRRRRPGQGNLAAGCRRPGRSRARRAAGDAGRNSRPRRT